MRAQIGPTDDHPDDQYCPNKYKIVIKHKNKNIFFLEWMKMKLKWWMLQRDYQRVGLNIGVNNIKNIISLIRPPENLPMSTQRKFMALLPVDFRYFK